MDHPERGWFFGSIEGIAIVPVKRPPQRTTRALLRFPYYEKPMDCTIVSMDGSQWTIHRRDASLNAAGSDVFIGTFGVDFFNEKA